MEKKELLQYALIFSFIIYLGIDQEKLAEKGFVIFISMMYAKLCIIIVGYCQMIHWMTKLKLLSDIEKLWYIELITKCMPYINIIYISCNDSVRNQLSFPYLIGLLIGLLYAFSKFTFSLLK